MSCRKASYPCPCVLLFVIENLVRGRLAAEDPPKGLCFPTINKGAWTMKRASPRAGAALALCCWAVSTGRTASRSLLRKHQRQASCPVFATAKTTARKTTRRRRPHHDRRGLPNIDISIPLPLHSPVDVTAWLRRPECSSRWACSARFALSDDDDHDDAVSLLRRRASRRRSGGRRSCRRSCRRGRRLYCWHCKWRWGRQGKPIWRWTAG